MGPLILDRLLAEAAAIRHGTGGPTEVENLYTHELLEGRSVDFVISKSRRRTGGRSWGCLPVIDLTEWKRS